MEIILVLLNDKIIFPAFEVLFFVLFIRAIIGEYWWLLIKTEAPKKVTRGEESWKMFYLGFGIVSVVLMQVINSSEALKGFKTIISIVNLAMLVYLAFFNGWFRNKTLGIITKSQQKEEKH